MFSFRLLSILAGAAIIYSAPSHAQLYNPPVATSSVDTSAFATKAEVATVKAAADAANARPIPTAATSAPPSVADTSATGNMTMQYALANHTHASKARKGRVLVPITGFTDVTFGTPFVTGAPLCVITAETAAGDTNVVNAQIDGATTLTGLRIRINRTAIVSAGLLSLNILSVPTQIATYAHYICVEP